MFSWALSAAAAGGFVRRLSKSFGLGPAGNDGNDESTSKRRLKAERLRRLRASETESLSLSTYFLGIFRLVYAYVFLQTFLFGLAISVSIVLNTSFVVARALEDPLFAPGQSVLWIFLTPIINITFAWLLDECLDLMMDTVKHSPWDKLNPLEIDDRAKFVYLSTGGGRPVLLNLRSSLAAILAAACVRPRPRSQVDHARVVKSDGSSVDSDVAVDGAGAGADDWWLSKDEDPDPLFILPDWIVLTVEIIFAATFVIFPLAFALSGGGKYHFNTIPAGFVTSLMLVAMIVAPVYAGLHLVVYLWPRAARINAFLRGKSIAEFAWPPYFTEFKDKEVIGAPLEVETVVKIDHTGKPRTQSLADDAVFAFQSVVAKHEMEDPVGMALERRRRLRCGVLRSQTRAWLIGR